MAIPGHEGTGSGTRSLGLNLPDLIPHATADGVFGIDTHCLTAKAHDRGRPGLFGIPGLAAALTGRKHNIKAHFFGHEHDDGGKWIRVGDTLCVNAATAIVTVRATIPERSMP